MIANNIFRWIGELFTWIFSVSMDPIRNSDSWTLQNAISWIFIIITFIAFFYWMGQLRNFKKEGNE